MGFYERMALTADRLLKGKGQAVTITRRSAGVYDPATGAATVTTTTQTGYAAIIDHNSNNIDGTLIKAGDKKLLLSPAGVSAPVLNDTVTVGGVVYTVVEPLKTVAPAGTVVMYELNLRA